MSVSVKSERELRDGITAGILFSALLSDRMGASLDWSVAERARFS